MDRNEMKGVAGGTSFLPASFGGFNFNVAYPVSAPKVAEIGGIASSYIGPVTAVTAQDDRDAISNVQ